MGRGTGQLMVPAESKSGVGTHSFWKRGITTMFDIIIVNLDTDSYLRMTPEKVLAKVENDNKEKYLQACLERRRNFTPMVYSVDGIPRSEALAAQRRLSMLISFNPKQ